MVQWRISFSPQREADWSSSVVAKLLRVLSTSCEDRNNIARGRDSGGQKNDRTTLMTSVSLVMEEQSRKGVARDIRRLKNDKTTRLAGTSVVSEENSDAGATRRIQSYPDTLNP